VRIAGDGEKVYAHGWTRMVLWGFSESARVGQSCCWSQFVDGDRHAVLHADRGAMKGEFCIFICWAGLHN
jgi:hypothetical protein